MAESASEAVFTDDADRRRVASDLAATLFVEAGAGTGKTRALVDRLVAIVRSGQSQLSEVAAITFTEAAAGELRTRVRDRLLELAEQTPGDVRILTALGELDDAAITTIHGFARRLLGEHAIAAGLPLQLTVLDEVSAELAFDRRFEAFLDELFDDRSAEQLLAAALALGINVAQLRAVARQLDDLWHLHRAELDRFDAGPVVADEAERASAEVAKGLADLVLLARHCLDEDDRLAQQLDALREVAERAGQLDDWIDKLRFLAELELPRAGRLGRQESWQGCEVSEVRSSIEGLAELRQSALERVHDLVLAALLDRLGAAAVEGAAERRRSGELVFHDLLVFCRDLLRDQPAVRAAARRRWQRLLVDEFQDTDELQYEIVSLLGAEAGSPMPDPGRLFFVGDPRQAIYRFRGADVALYERARNALGAGRTRLVTNFRSVPGVLEFVNGIFAELLAGDGATESLVPARSSSGPAVWLLGGPIERKGAEARRSEEAARLADTVARVVEEGWQVESDEGLRPACYSDVALLVTRRTGLSELESALEAAQVPYRLASNSLVYSSQEVRDLLACLRAIDQPGEERAVVAALRTPAFGCDDPSLVAYRLAGGRWRLDLAPPAELEHDPVARSLSELRSLSGRRMVLGVVGTIEAVLRERSLFQLAAGDRRRGDAWRRLARVLEEARAFAAAGGDGLGDFLRWAERQAVSPSRECLPAEDDDDVVTVLTVHAAKGLEFPVVGLAELGSLARSLSGPTVLRGASGQLEVRVRKGMATAGFEAAAAEDREAGRREQVRLAYVAATRARDHLIVSVVHEPAGSPESATLAEQIWHARERAGGWRPLSPRAVGAPATVAETSAAAPDHSAIEGDENGLASYRRWRAQRRALFDRLAVPAAVAPTELAGPTGADAAESTSRSPGRVAATALGRAVHGVLQGVDLATGEGLDRLALAEAAAEGCAERADEVQALARSALATSVVRAAALSGSARRELSFAVPIGPGVLDGVVDLCFFRGDQLVVVDYKTDALSSPAEVPAAAVSHWLQAGAYVLALERALGRRVDRFVLVFLAPPDGAIEHELSDLRGLAAAAASALDRRFSPDSPAASAAILRR